MTIFIVKQSAAEETGNNIRKKKSNVAIRLSLRRLNYV